MERLKLLPLEYKFFSELWFNPQLAKTPIFVPKNKKNLSNLAIFRAFQDYFMLQVDHPTNMTNTTVSHQDHTKIKEKIRRSTQFPKKPSILLEIPILCRAKHPQIFCSNPPISALKNPQNLSIFNQYRSKYRQILPKSVFLRQNSSNLRLNTTIYLRRSTNPAFDEKWRIRRKTATPTTSKLAEKTRQRARRAKKENPEKKKNFSF